MSDPKSFAFQWDDFAARILPKDVGQVQAVETRRAFYAGGAALFHTIMTLLEPGVEATDADYAMLDRLNAEFEAFAKDLGEGRA